MNNKPKKMSSVTKGLIAFVVLASLAGAGAGVVVWLTNKNVVDEANQRYQKELSDVKTVQNALSKAIAQNQKEAIASLAFRLEDEVQDLESVNREEGKETVEEAKEDIEKAWEQINILGVNSQIDKTRQAIQDGDVATAEIEKSRLEKYKEKLEARTSATAANALSRANTALAEQQGRINTITQTKVTELNSNRERIEQKIAQQETRPDAIKVLKEELETEIASIETKITDLEKIPVENTNQATKDAIANAKLKVLEANVRVEVLGVEEQIAKLQSVLNNANHTITEIETAKESLNNVLPTITATTPTAIRTARTNADTIISLAESRVLVLEINAEQTKLQNILGKANPTIAEIETAKESLNNVLPTITNATPDNVRRAKTSADVTIDSAVARVQVITVNTELEKLQTILNNNASTKEQINTAKLALELVLTDEIKSSTEPTVRTARTNAETAIDAAILKVNLIIVNTELEKLQTVLNNEASSNDEIDSARQSLEAVLTDEIEADTNPTLVNAVINARTAITNAEAKVQVRKINTATTNLQNVLDNADSTEQQVKDAREALEKAIPETDENTKDDVVTAKTTAVALVERAKEQNRLFDIRTETTELQTILNNDASTSKEIEDAIASLENVLPTIDANTPNEVATAKTTAETLIERARSRAQYTKIREAEANLQTLLSKPSVTATELEAARDSLNAVFPTTDANTPLEVTMAKRNAEGTIAIANKKIQVIKINNRIAELQVVVNKVGSPLSEFETARSNLMALLTNEVNTSTDQEFITVRTNANNAITEANIKFLKDELEAKTATLITTIEGTDASVINNAKIALETVLARVTANANQDITIAKNNADNEITNAENRLTVLDINAKTADLDTKIKATSIANITSARLALFNAIQNARSSELQSIKDAITAAETKISAADNRIIVLQLDEQIAKVNTAITAEIRANIESEKTNLEGLIRIGESNTDAGIIAAIARANTANNSADTAIKYLTDKVDIENKIAILNTATASGNIGRINIARSNLNSAISADNLDDRLADVIETANTAISNGDKKIDEVYAATIVTQTTDLTEATTEDAINTASSLLQAEVNRANADDDSEDVLKTAVANANTAIGQVPARISAIRNSNTAKDLTEKTKTLRTAIASAPVSEITTPKEELSTAVNNAGASSDTAIQAAVALANAAIADADGPTITTSRINRVVTATTALTSANTEETINTTKTALEEVLNSFRTNESTASTLNTAIASANTELGKVEERIKAARIDAKIKILEERLDGMSVLLQDIINPSDDLKNNLPSDEENTSDIVKAAVNRAAPVIRRADIRISGISIGIKSTRLQTATRGDNIGNIENELSELKKEVNSVPEDHKTDAELIDRINTANQRIGEAEAKLQVFRIDQKISVLTTMNAGSSSGDIRIAIRNLQEEMTASTSTDSTVEQAKERARTSIAEGEARILVVRATSRADDQALYVNQKKELLIAAIARTDIDTITTAIADLNIAIEEAVNDEEVVRTAKTSAEAEIIKANNRVEVLKIEEKKSLLSTAIAGTDIDAITAAITNLETEIDASTSTDDTVTTAKASARMEIVNGNNRIQVINIEAAKTQLTTAIAGTDIDAINTATTNLNNVIATMTSTDDIVIAAKTVARAEIFRGSARIQVLNIEAAQTPLTTAIAGTDIDAINTAITNLETEIATSNSTYGIVTTAKTVARAEIVRGNARIQVLNIEAAQTPLTTAIAGTDIDAINTAITNLETEITMSNSTDDTVTTAKAVARAEIARGNARIQVLNIGAAQTRLTTAITGTDIDEINNAITNLETEITTSDSTDDIVTAAKTEARLEINRGNNRIIVLNIMAAEGALTTAIEGGVEATITAAQTELNTLIEAATDNTDPTVVAAVESANAVLATVPGNAEDNN